MSKTFDRKDIFTVATAELAKDYIGKEGYFGDSIRSLESEIKDGCIDTLKDISPDNDVDAIFGAETIDLWYGLFLPVDKVKEVKDKGWRPYKDFNEFNYKVGDIVHLRSKEHHEFEYLFLITGFIYSSKAVCLNGELNDFGYLFSAYEIKSQGEWKPFGVKE